MAFLTYVVGPRAPLVIAPGLCSGHQPGALRWVDGVAGGAVWAAGNWHRFYTNGAEDVLDASLQWTDPGPFVNHPNPSGSTTVWISPSGTVWATASGAVATWDGSTWTPNTPTIPTNTTIAGLAGSSDSDVYVVFTPDFSTNLTTNQIQYAHWTGSAWANTTVSMGHPTRRFFPLDPQLTSDGVLRVAGTDRDDGTATDPDSHTYGFIAALTGGSPGVEYRSTALGGNGGIFALTLTSSTHGYAAGYSPVTGSDPLPRLWELTSGTWAPMATQIPWTGHDPLGGTFDAWFTRVRATSSSNLWAVGYYSNDGGTPAHSNILVWQWNGSTWTEHSFPDYADPPGFSGPQVAHVWTSAAGDTWIVGHCVTQADGIEHQFAHAWNGTTWTDRTLPDEGPQPPP